MTDDEIIVVVTAHKEGKQIQFKYRAGHWIDCDSSPDWNFWQCDYRVKPEPRKPREWRVCVNDNNHIFEVKPQDPHHCIIVREVIEE